MKKLLKSIVSSLYEITFIFAFIALCAAFPFALLALPVLVVYIVYCLLRNKKNYKLFQGNGTIFGSRGSGKSLLFMFLANRLPRHSSNVPFNKKTEDLNVREYVNSIEPNTIRDIIEGKFITVEKKEKYEKLPILIDDITLYFPNFEDSKLKSLYPQMPLTLAINRHLYNNFNLINVQDFDRPYKVLKELQTDFAIKVEQSKVSWLPFLRLLIRTDFIYYEKVKSASEGILPPPRFGILKNRTKKVDIQLHVAQFGEIFRSSVYQRLSKITYDTRFYHEKFFGFPAPKKKKYRSN